MYNYSVRMPSRPFPAQVPVYRRPLRPLKRRYPRADVTLCIAAKSEITVDDVPGQSLDFKFAKILLGMGTALKQVKEYLESNPGEKGVDKNAINSVIAVYERAKANHLIYHQAVEAGATPDPTVLKQDIDALTMWSPPAIKLVLSFGSAPTIVACTDTQGSTANSTTETMGKMADLPFGFFALLAGEDMSVTREIAEIVGDFLEREPPGVGVDTLGTLRRAIGLYKRRYAESYIESALGISYEEFRSKGSTELPEDLYRNLHWEIRNHQSGAELLICGFVSGPIGAGEMVRPVIFKISGDTAWSCEHFGVIGSGTDIGESSLYYREQSMAHPITGPYIRCMKRRDWAKKHQESGKRQTCCWCVPR